MVPAGGAVNVEFDPVTLPDRAVRGTVRAGTDAMPGDNAFHFVLNAGRAIRVLVVEPRGAGSPYLARALEVSPDHAVTSISGERLGDAVLADYDAVVLNGAEPADADRLEAFVRAGGGLIVVLGERSRTRSWAGTDLLPGAIGGTRTSETGTALTALRSEHPVFEPFRAGTAGLTAARFYRYREVGPRGDADVLARFGGGGPALLLRAAGRGRVVVLAAPLDGAWSDLVLQPAFVPLSHRLVRHASGREPGPEWRTVGDLLDAGEFLTDDGPEAPASASRSVGDHPVLLTPSDRAVSVDASTLFTLAERGFYELRDPASGQVVPVAVNGDPAESEPGLLDSEVVATTVSGGAPTTVASFAPEDRERRQSLWWYFLAGAFVLLAAETMLSNGLSRRPMPVMTGGVE